MKSVKYSGQRESIKRYLASTKEHPTADMVYAAVREEYPSISLGTIYRNLTFLEQHGEIIKLSCGGESERYDANTGQHYHFICQSCGSVIDLDMISLDHIDVIAGEKFKGVIEGHRAFFYGKCEACLAKENAAQDAG